jgi:hypothetical protein
LHAESLRQVVGEGGQVTFGHGHRIVIGAAQVDRVTNSLMQDDVGLFLADVSKLPTSARSCPGR